MAEEIIPFEIGDTRIDMKKLLAVDTGVLTHRFFLTAGVKWALKLARWRVFTVSGKPHVQRLFLVAQQLESLVISDREVPDLVFTLISIGRSIPASVRDVGICSALRLMFWKYTEKVESGEALARSGKDRRDYIARFLSKKEKELWERVVQESTLWKPQPLSPRKRMQLKDVIL